MTSRLLFATLLVLAVRSNPVCAATDWVAQGFQFDESLLFQQNGVSIQEARKWLKHRFTASRAVSWIAAGFSIEEAENWARFQVLYGHTAQQLLEAGYSIDYLSKWLRYGMLSIDSIQELNAIGFNLEEADRWAALGYSPNDWIGFIRHGYNYEQAAQWAKMGARHISDVLELTKINLDLDDAVTWYKAHIPFDDWMEWKRAHFTINEASQWIENGISKPATALRLGKYGFTAEMVPSWKSVTASHEDWIRFHQMGLSPSDVAEWIRVNVNTPYQVKRYQSYGLTPDTIAQWQGAGINDEHTILSYAENGIFSANDKLAWDALGVSDPLAWVTSGLSIEEAKVWLEKGFRNPREIEGFKEKNWTPEQAMDNRPIRPLYWGVGGLLIVLLGFLMAGYWEEFVRFGQWFARTIWKHTFLRSHKET